MRVIRQYVVYPPKDSEPSGTPFCICVKSEGQKHGHNGFIAGLDNGEDAQKICDILNGYEKLITDLMTVSDASDAAIKAILKIN